MANTFAFPSPLKSIYLLSFPFAIVAGARTFAQSSDWQLVNGKTLITRKGSDERISGLTVKLSSDPQ